MYCYQRDKIRAYWRFLHQISEKSRDLFLSASLPLSGGKSMRTAGALFDILHRWTRPNKRPAFNIPAVNINENIYPVTKITLFEKPFCNLKLFAKQGYNNSAQPSILVVAPLSGHYATLLRDTIHTLLRHHNVYLTDWISAYNVPLSDGEFDLNTYVDYLKEFLELIGPNTHLMAVCQPCVPVLMVTALMAEEKNPCVPKTMILMGGPIDTQINPTRVNKVAEMFPLTWFEKNMVSVIPYYAPGAGRKVTPGNLILGGFIQMNLYSHLKKHADYVLSVANQDTKAVKAHQTFYDEYLSVMDLPAEYFLQTIDKIFQQHLLPKNQIDYRGKRLNFKAIDSTALMTIEGENDDITGIGQTYAAHTICPNISENKREHFLRLDVGHYGIFSGTRWRKDIYPKIRSFVHKHS